MNDAGRDALVLDTTEEKQLTKEVSAVERRASDIIIRTDVDYAMAGELTKQVKTAQKKVEEYWEPMRESTYKAYKSVTDHKKEMIDPLKNAEKILKSKMGEYTMEQERKRREQEAEMRRLAEIEREKKLAEAEAAESKGDIAAAEFAMAEAEVMDNVAVTGTVQVAAPKVEGISKTKAWRITGIDDEKVPIDIAGIVIRPVDEKAILNLIKQSKGKIKIPGVTFEETVSISVRS